MKILVVDDEQAVRESLRRSLRFNGYEVLTANDGLEAVETVRAENPELLILDIMMPGDDGFTLCQQIRRDSQVPIIMLTAASDEADRVIGLERGADDYIAKPFRFEELLADLLEISRDDAGSFLGAYVAKGILEIDPFISIDRDGVGELVKIGVERGRATRPNLKVGICGEHGGDPDRKSVV